MTTNFQQANREAKLQKTIYSFVKTMSILFIIQMFVNIGFWSWSKWVVMGYVISIISQAIKSSWSGDYDNTNANETWNKRNRKVEDATIVIEEKKKDELDLDSRLGKSERKEPVYRDSDFV
jgi:hypothetical protein